MNTRMERLGRRFRFSAPASWRLVSAALFLFAIYWIYPFFNLRVNPVFNSDSAIVLTAITQRIPLAENLFQWGGARTGFALGALGAIFTASSANFISLTFAGSRTPRFLSSVPPFFASHVPDGGPR